MSEMVTLEISEDVARKARAIAAVTHRRFEDVLADWLDSSVADVPVEQLPDDELLATVEMQLAESQQQELSDLLADQRENQLNEAGRTRLDALMQIYQQGMVRKSQALRVAVQRGLMPPLG